MKFLSCCLLFFPLIVNAELYKSVGPEGETVYTDFPTKNATKIKKSELPELSTYNPRQLPDSIHTTPTPPPPSQTTSSYSHFSIIAPKNQATIHTNTGATLNLALAPQLQTKLGHTILLSINGIKQSTRYTSTQISLPILNRGENLIRAIIIDDHNKEIISTPVLTFYVKQFSALQKKPNIGQINNPREPRNPRKSRTPGPRSGR